MAVTRQLGAERLISRLPVGVSSLWPIHGERIDFLHSDICGDFRRSEGAQRYLDAGDALCTIRESRMNAAFRQRGVRCVRRRQVRDFGRRLITVHGQNGRKAPSLVGITRQGSKQAPSRSVSTTRKPSYVFSQALRSVSSHQIPTDSIEVLGHGFTIK